jgi:copper oxidase (laccase) domain-containing protein
MASIEKKMRIQLFDPEFNMVSDRLVSQDTEFYKGPPEEGNLDLKQLVRNQLARSTDPGNILEDDVDTYGDKDENGEPLWWSCRRGDGAKRNGVMVVYDI